jgi:hypothetical protein
MDLHTARDLYRDGLLVGYSEAWFDAMKLVTEIMIELYDANEPGLGALVSDLVWERLRDGRDPAAQGRHDRYVQTLQGIDAQRDSRFVPQPQ